MTNKPVPQTKIPIPQQILNLKARNIRYAWNKYVAVNKKYINKTLLINDFRDSDDREHLFPLEDATAECGKIRIDGKQKWVWLIFYKLYPFFGIHKKGSSSEGKITQTIPIKHRFKDIQAETTILEKYYPDMTEAKISALDKVPVDLKSLGNYIANHPDIKQAEAIMDIVNECQSKGITTTPLLPYDINPSPFGRTYHRGVNLQTCKKEVRHAALGRCYEYDLNAAVVAVKLTMMEKLFYQTGEDIDAHYPCSVDYLDKKNEIRKQLRDVLYNARLARHQSNPANTSKPTKAEALADIKSVFTVVSFGADRSKSYWFSKTGEIQYGALDSIIADKGDSDAVMKTRGGFLRKFIDEQKEITKKIVDDFEADKSKKQEVADMRSVIGKRKNKSKEMAYIYQHRETEIIEQLEEGITAKLKTNPVILRIHDGFYSSRKIPKAMIQDILDEIQRENCKDFRGFITASEEPINP